MCKGINKIALLSLCVAGISFVLAFVSRFSMKPLPLAPGLILAEDFLQFTNTCLLITITFLLIDIARVKK